jgi:hypothetical protein
MHARSGERIGKGNTEVVDRQMRLVADEPLLRALGVLLGRHRTPHLQSGEGILGFFCQTGFSFPLLAPHPFLVLPFLLRAFLLASFLQMRPLRRFLSEQGLLPCLYDGAVDAQVPHCHPSQAGAVAPYEPLMQERWLYDPFDQAGEPAHRRRARDTAQAQHLPQTLILLQQQERFLHARQTVVELEHLDAQHGQQAVALPSG